MNIQFDTVFPDLAGAAIQANIEAASWALGQGESFSSFLEVIGSKALSLNWFGMNGLGAAVPQGVAAADHPVNQEAP